MARSLIHLLAGGPGSDRSHAASLLRESLRASGLHAPRIAYVGAASGDDVSFFRRLSSLLREAGAANVVLARTCGRRAGDGAAARTVLAGADAVFVSGGDVEAGMRALEAAGMVAPLRERWDAGVPFLGLSAGSMMIGREWIAWDDEDDESTARVFPCLDLAPLVCDTHSEDDDWSELRAWIGRQAIGVIGYGISAPAMLRVHPDGRLEPRGGEVVRLERVAGGVRRTLVGPS